MVCAVLLPYFASVLEVNVFCKIRWELFKVVVVLSLINFAIVCCSTFLGKKKSESQHHSYLATAQLTFR